LVGATRRPQRAHSRHATPLDYLSRAEFFLALILVSGIGCGGAGDGTTPQQQTTSPDPPPVV
jgi:hypothetical protein